MPYGATAVRPAWDDLPAAVRAAINGRLGAPVTHATSAGGGFTQAFAGLLRTRAGLSAFVKAAPLTDPEAGWYAREAAITAALPPEVPAPRPQWTLTEAGWFILCLDPIDGHVPALPWSPADLDAALTAWSTAATSLAAPPNPPAQPPPDAPPLLADLARDHLSWWSAVADGRAAMPVDAPGWVPGRLGELAALERDLLPLVAGTGMLHGDLRVDNVLIDRDGRAWICDWTWPCLGAPWFDTVTLLVSAYASGLDVEARLGDAPWRGVSGVLAAMGGYWLAQASDTPDGASPHSRQHHLFSGTQALAWLAEREGW